MKRTLFAGLLIVEPGEPISEDNGVFMDGDRVTIDKLLEVGAKTHRHTGLSGLANPSAPASAGVIASAGTLASELAISVGYTLEDENGGETMLSPVATVSTAAAISLPQAAPSAVADYTGGSLPVNTYYYATTFSDGAGGETALGPAVVCERAPAFASGRVQLSALTYGMAAAGGKAWRLYRAIGGGQYGLLAEGTSDNYTDDGSVSPNCSIHPPTGEENTTRGTSTLLVKLPSAVAGAQFINLYASVTGDFGGGSFLARYPVASAGRTVTFSTLELGTEGPPPVNLSIGGAHQIDPDSELLDWHWKRPVSASANLGSGTLGDVRFITGTGRIYAVLGSAAASPSQWTRIGSAGVSASGSTGTAAELGQLTFLGSAGTVVQVQETANGKAKITIDGGSQGKADLEGGKLKESQLPSGVVRARYQPVMVPGVPHVFNVKDGSFGAKGDGVTDDTAAFEAAAAAWKAARAGIYYIPPGEYKLAKAGFLALEYPGQSIQGAGKGATFLNPTSAVTGNLITWRCLPASDQPAGVISDLTINGESAGENAVGIEIGDVIGHTLRDVVVRRFTASGGIGIKMHNAAYWTEQGHWSNVTLDNNATDLQFSKSEGATTSFAYHTASHLRLNVFKNQCGIRLKGTVKLYNTFLRVTGNLHEEGCVGIELADESRLWGQLAIALESASSAPVPLKLSASAAIKRSSGFVDTSEGGGLSSNAGTKNITFNGVFRVPGIASSEVFRQLGTVKNLKPASEVTAKELCEAIEELGLVE